MEKTKITPVIIGADLNCYNVARAFHMEYGVKSYAFGRYAISATKYSRLIDFTCVQDLDNDETLIKTLKDFAKDHTGEKLILFGCTDDYACLIAKHRNDLPEYVIPYPDKRIIDTVAKKAEFYEICDKFGIPYPKTVIIEHKVDEKNLAADLLGFDYPIIIKPSSSVDYWKHSFDGMKKVYTAASPQAAKEIIDKIYSSGYPDRVILQEMIDGGDCNMRVFTAFSDSKGKVRATCLGHTMLEEHTPKGLGNHAAIITEPVSSFPLADKICKMLESLSYTGFSNFDIKLREGTDGDFKVFEINLRQGRSNFYMTAAGINVARLAAEVFESDGDSVENCEKSVFWHHIPRSVVYKYAEDEKLVALAKKLDKEGLGYSSIWYTPDICLNPMRFICVAEQLRRQITKFKKYYPIKTKKGN